MRRTEKETGEFIAIMAKELPQKWSGEAVSIWCRLMMRKSTTLNRINELTSSVQMSDQEIARLEKLDDRTTEAAKKQLTEVGMSAEFGGDPRGAAIKIQVPSRKTNDWGQVGICVP